jgi:molybdopterin-binding protein
VRSAGSIHRFRAAAKRCIWPAIATAGGSDPVELSARNVLRGRVVEVRRGQTTAHVRLDIGGGTAVTASITNEAVDELALKEGEEAYAVVKASNVMVAKD